ncbi:alkyl sulfatase C-terminal domain-containing protein [Microbacterium trichothecenolyticum]|uniref:alkyl sulfatase C-terminal domain-containing protein n=1 Tax=Microbacterium trichothecenolyticum TaxID=69370 RepID=UPI0027E2E897|nr:alkyl sulfatase C-terminal domain-containing protein [Microbacterium trichothecenolyticum]
MVPEGFLDLSLDVVLTDLDRSFHLMLRNGVLVYVERDADPATPLQLTLSKSRLIQLAGGDTDSDGIDVRGDIDVLKQILGVLDQGDPDFQIVLP